jgi:hypothetical protein
MLHKRPLIISGLFCFVTVFGTDRLLPSWHEANMGVIGIGFLGESASEDPALTRMGPRAETEWLAV